MRYGEVVPSLDSHCLLSKNGIMPPSFSANLLLLLSDRGNVARAVRWGGRQVGVGDVGHGLQVSVRKVFAPGRPMGGSPVEDPLMMRPKKFRLRHVWKFKVD